MAMHAFSAVPDIEADRQAKLTTTATILGHKGTLLYCALLWTISAALPLFENPWLGYITIFLLPLYIALLLLSAKPSRTFSMYRLFPILNMVSGTVLAWHLLGIIFTGFAI
jgi:4-hydroxybenzoate polyprenyltransferase